MAEYDLTQREADALIALPKVRVDDEFRYIRILHLVYLYRWYRKIAVRISTLI